MPRSARESGPVLASVAALAVAIAFTSASAVSAASKNLPAQLGFIQLCTTSMADVTARVGRAKDLSTSQLGLFVRRGWHDPATGAFLLLDRLGDASHRDRGLKGAPPIVMATLAAGSHLQAYLKAEKRNVEDFGRSRISLTSLRGPNGIKLGASRATMVRVLGPGLSEGRRGDVQTYGYHDLQAPIRRPGCGVAGFILGVTFTGEKLTRIEIIEAS